MEGPADAAGMNLAEFQEAKQTVEDFLSRGSRLVEVGNYSDALRVFTNALRIYPNHIRCYIARGYVYQEMGHFQKAVEDHSRAVELDRKNPVAKKYLSIALTALGRKMLAAGKPAHARSIFARSLKFCPDNAEALEYLQNLEMNFSPMAVPSADELPPEPAMTDASEQMFIVPKLETSVPAGTRAPGTVLLPCPWSPDQPQQQSLAHGPQSEHALPQWFNRSPSKQASAKFDTSMAEFMSKFDDLESLWGRGETAVVAAAPQPPPPPPPGFELQHRSDSGYSTMDDQARQQHQHQQQWKQPKFYHHKNESSFKEVVPRPLMDPSASFQHRARFGQLAPLTVSMRSEKEKDEDAGPGEDLLISPKTHFKPIQEGETFNDGTSFSAPTTIEDPVQFVRDESGAFLTLTADSGSNCGSPKKYMVYRRKGAEQWTEYRQAGGAEEDEDEEPDLPGPPPRLNVDVEPAQMTFCKKNGPGENFVPKFKVHCSKREKICQTDERDMVHARVSNEQFINDLFVGAPRSGHGFPAHFDASPPSHAEKIQQW